MDDPTGIGTRIERTRQLLGETQAEFADRLGVSPMTISRWENGAARPRGRGVRAQLLALIDAVARDHRDGQAGHETLCVGESTVTYGAADDMAAIASSAVRFIDWRVIEAEVERAIRRALLGRHPNGTGHREAPAEEKEGESAS